MLAVCLLILRDRGVLCSPASVLVTHCAPVAGGGTHLTVPQRVITSECIIFAVWWPDMA